MYKVNFHPNIKTVTVFVVSFTQLCTKFNKQNSGQTAQQLNCKIKWWEKKKNFRLKSF